MSNREIAIAWERAQEMAERIWSAHVTGVGVEQAKRDQQSLSLWLGMVREYGYVYNGYLDEYATMRI